jgi:hypothetical protein
MQTMAAVVDAEAAPLEAAGVSADDILLLEHADICATEAAQLIRGADTRRPRT